MRLQQCHLDQLESHDVNSSKPTTYILVASFSGRTL